MISFWPFNKGSGGRIQDLKAPQIADTAIKSFKKNGRHPISLRLLYRALELDPFNPEALILLSELYRGQKKGARPSGDEVYAGIIIEYAMDRKVPLPAEQRHRLDAARTEIMTLWGFITPRGTEFDADHLAYMSFINEQMAQVRSVANGFRIALVKLGVQAGTLDLAKGTQTKTYQDWLRSDASALHI